MPSNAPAESAATPAGPVMEMPRPFSPVPEIVLMSATESAILSQPSVSTLIGAMTCNAALSAEGTGPMIWPVTPGTAAIAFASAAAFAWSAGVIPPARS